jgi:hypothetical protein
MFALCIYLQVVSANDVCCKWSIHVRGRLCVGVDSGETLRWLGTYFNALPHVASGMFCGADLCTLYCGLTRRGLTAQFLWVAASNFGAYW